MQEIRPMSNNQIKKSAALAFNLKRREAHVEAVRLAQDKIDNPEKYTRSNHKDVIKAQAFMAAALAINPNGFESRHATHRTLSEPKLTKIELVIGGKYNFKGQPERLIYVGNNLSGNGYWHQFEKVDEPGKVWSEMQDSDLVNIEQTKEEPILIKNWIELAKVKGTGDYVLDITPEDGSGWIRQTNPEDSSFPEYLSTHTFYGRNHEYSTKVLQEHGFNVVLANWDDKSCTQ